MNTVADADFPLDPHLQSFTVAAVPSAADWKQRLIFVTNGNAGAACVACSDGANWKVIELGANIAAA
jgi:hypothetical protein